MIVGHSDQVLPKKQHIIQYFDILHHHIFQRNENIYKTIEHFFKNKRSISFKKNSVSCYKILYNFLVKSLSNTFTCSFTASHQIFMDLQTDCFQASNTVVNSVHVLMWVRWNYIILRAVTSIRKTKQSLWMTWKILVNLFLHYLNLADLLLSGNEKFNDKKKSCYMCTIKLLKGSQRFAGQLLQIYLFSATFLMY